MVEVAGRPILETLIERLVARGFRRILISVRYLGDSIVDYFGDGHHWEAEISYIHETVALGTGGVLRLLPAGIAWPLLVINGDLLIDADFAAMVAAHEMENTKATMGVREYQMQIPYGVVRTAGSFIVGFEEKPVIKARINAGVYVLAEAALRFMPEGPFTMPELFEELLGASYRGFERQDWNLHVGGPHVYEIKGSWADIGTPADLDHAQRQAASP